MSLIESIAMLTDDPALQTILSVLFGTVLKTIVLIVPLILSVAYLTYWERKVIAAMQMRRGPNVVGPFGLWQPFADGLKLMCKEVILPTDANKVVFLLAPMITFFLSIAGWAVVPFAAKSAIANINVGVLYLLAISSLGVYGIIMAGWSSNSKYAFLGAIRSSAQMISYEVSMGLVIVTVVIASGSMNLTDIVLAKQSMPLWMQLLLMPMAVVFFISILAETNRLPFDLPEAEAELVAGYNVEYYSITFALFFLGEYANMILTSAMTALLFFGGWMPPFDFEILYQIPPALWLIGKIVLLLYVFLWVRATFPRYRYDQLMRLGWKVFLPFTLAWVILIAALVVYQNV